MKHTNVHKNTKKTNQTQEVCQRSPWLMSELALSTSYFMGHLQTNTVEHVPFTVFEIAFKVAVRRHTIQASLADCSAEQQTYSNSSFQLIWSCVITFLPKMFCCTLRNEYKQIHLGSVQESLETTWRVFMPFITYLYSMAWRFLTRSVLVGNRHQHTTVQSIN